MLSCVQDSTSSMDQLQHSEIGHFFPDSYAIPTITPFNSHMASAKLVSGSWPQYLYACADGL